MSVLKALCIQLNDGNQMPMVGLGTFQGSYDYKVYASDIRCVLICGYRFCSIASI